MPLWHDRKLNTDALTTQYKSFPRISSLEKRGNAKLGLLPAPYPCGSVYTYSTGTSSIILAIDGTLENIGALTVKLGLHSASVADVICTLYLRRGSEGLYLLKGAASIILYDAKEEKTVLHRLFLTGQPLYFVAKNNRLTVCTNPVYLLHRDDIDDTIDKAEITQLFAIKPLSWKMDCFSEIESIAHGELIIISLQGIDRKKRALDKIFYKTRSVLSDKETVSQYRALLESAVNEYIKPDKKYGIMLSSGMDSSVIAVYAARRLQSEGRELVAYSWTLPNDSADESDKIKKICHHLNIPLKLFNGELFGPFDKLDNLFLLPDTPLVNSFWPLNQECYRLAAEDGVDFLFNGNFADLLFVSRGKQLASAWHDQRFDLLFPIIKEAIKKRGLNNIFCSLTKRLSSQKKSEQNNSMPWLTEKAVSALGKERDTLPQHGFESFQFALCPFHAGYLGGERYLSELHGLQRIEPHKNLALMNFSLTIPSYLTYRKGLTKYFVRAAMRDLLPEEVTKQPRVGLLSSFAIKSFIRNRKKVRKKVFENKSSWDSYIQEDWMLEKLQDKSDIDNTDIYIIWLCINLGEWQKAIKPGGSLYEYNA